MKIICRCFGEKLRLICLTAATVILSQTKHMKMYLIFTILKHIDDVC